MPDSFFCSHDGKEWIPLKKGINGSLPGASAMGRLSGILTGLYPSSNGVQSTNSGEFDWFE